MQLHFIQDPIETLDIKVSYKLSNSSDNHAKITSQKYSDYVFLGTMILCGD